MKHSIWLKILLCLALLGVLLFVGFISVIMTVFSVSQKFYVPVVMITTGVLMVFIVLRIFGLVNPKTLYLSLGTFFIIGMLVITGYEINCFFQNNIPIVNEQGVNLNLYQPFQENTKVVSLPESSTLQIKDNLPIIDGATALYPLYSAFARATYPYKKYDPRQSEVMCNTTVGAYQNLIDGKVDLIFVARPSQDQLETAKNEGVVLKLTPIGREAFVFFVNSKNPITELAVNQIQDIYSGKISNWKELGGKNEAIRAFQRPENSGSQTMFQKLMEGKNLMTPPKEDVVAGMGGIIEQTADYRNYKNAIGYSFLFFATEMIGNNQIRLLKVNGVIPDKTTIKSKKYPLAADFYAVTAGSKNPNTEVLIKWILSPQGQYIVDQTGYTPIK